MAPISASPKVQASQHLATDQVKESPESYTQRRWERVEFNLEMVGSVGTGKRKGMFSVAEDNAGCAQHRWLSPYRRVGCFPQQSLLWEVFPTLFVTGLSQFLSTTTSRPTKVCGRKTFHVVGNPAMW